MKGKLTQGPWCLQSQGTGEPLSIMGQDNRFICRMDEGSFKDAELIAAAPDLLEACTSVLHQLSTDSDLETITGRDKYAYLVEYLRGVIAKATLDK